VREVFILSRYHALKYSQIRDDARHLGENRRSAPEPGLQELQKLLKDYL